MYHFQAGMTWASLQSGQDSAGNPHHNKLRKLTIVAKTIARSKVRTGGARPKACPSARPAAKQGSKISEIEEARLMRIVPPTASSKLLSQEKPIRMPNESIRARLATGYPQTKNGCKCCLRMLQGAINFIVCEFHISQFVQDLQPLRFSCLPVVFLDLPWFPYRFFFLIFHGFSIRRTFLSGQAANIKSKAMQVTTWRFSLFNFEEGCHSEAVATAQITANTAPSYQIKKLKGVVQLEWIYTSNGIGMPETQNFVRKAQFFFGIATSKCW